jgi:hypothetical protein
MCHFVRYRKTKIPKDVPSPFFKKKVTQYFYPYLNDYINGYQLIDNMLPRWWNWSCMVWLFINLGNVAYPFVEKKSKYIGCKGLAPELHNQLKYTPPTFRHSNKMISKNLIEAQASSFSFIYWSNAIIILAQNICSEYDTVNFYKICVNSTELVTWKFNLKQ